MSIAMLIFSLVSFLLLPFVIMSLFIFLPRIIGKRIPPSFSFENNILLNDSLDNIYKALTDYENYPNIFKNIKRVEVEVLPSGKKNIYEYYQSKKMLDLLCVREEENKLCSLVRRTYEYTSLWTFNLVSQGESSTIIFLKETVYVYDSYLRFMLRFILRGNLQRVYTLNSLKKYLENK